MLRDTISNFSNFNLNGEHLTCTHVENFMLRAAEEPVLTHKLKYQPTFSRGKCLLPRNTGQHVALMISSAKRVFRGEDTRHMLFF